MGVKIEVEDYEISLVKDTLMRLKPPFYYDQMGQTVLDQTGRQVVDIRGWGWIQKLDNPERRQDALGETICGLLNQLIKE